MYFNDTNDTNIDRELKKGKKIKKERKNRESIFKNFNFRFSPDILLICFYALLFIVGIVLIIVSTR